MKRRIFKLFLFLLLGAIVNVSVAWSFIMWGGGIKSAQNPLSRLATKSDFAWLVDLGWQPATDTEHWKHKEEIIDESYTSLTLRFYVENPRFEELYGSIFSGIWFCAARLRAGWPILSMEGALVYEAALEPRDARSFRNMGRRSIKTRLPPHEGSPPYDRERTIGAFRLPKSDALGGAADGHLLPLKPIWPAFAINTVFYAAILWIPFVPFQIRRYLRVKRGLCTKCGYDLRGTEHQACPECGMEIC